MGLPWVRLDTQFSSNPKLLALLAEPNGYRAAFGYLCSLAYSGGQGTDGFVPVEALPFIHLRRTDAQRLVEHRLWITQPGGWLINGWDEKQESTEETKQRRVRAQAGAAARWPDDHLPMSNAERQRKYRNRQKVTMLSNDADGPLRNSAE